MYSAEQNPVLNRIVYLRDSGFQAAEIAAALNAGDDSLLMKQLDEKYEEIKKTILEEKEKLKKIEVARRAILTAGTGMHYDVMIKTVPGYQVLSLRRVLPDYYGEGVLWAELSAYATENHIPVSGDTFSIYHDADNGTPVLDIKPYTPSYDRVENPLVPAWCSRWPKNTETSGDFDWDEVFNF